MNRQSSFGRGVATVTRNPLRRRLLPKPEACGDPAEVRQAQPPTPTPSSRRLLRVLRAALGPQAVRVVVQTALYEPLQQENRALLVQTQRTQDSLD